MRKWSRPFQGALHPIPKINTRSKPYVREQEMAMTISLFSMTYVRCLEREPWKHITKCKTDSQWEFAVWLRKLKEGLDINPEGWDAVGDGGGLKGRGYMYVYTYFCL